MLVRLFCFVSREAIFTANDIERASCDERENVKWLVNCLVELLDEYGTLFIEHADKFLQDFKVESWC